MHPELDDNCRECEYLNICRGDCWSIEVGKEIGKKARERVVRLHDWDMLARKYEKALKEVLH